MLVKANKYIIPFGVRVAQCFVIADMYLTFKFKQILKRVAIGKGINDFFFTKVMVDEAVGRTAVKRSSLRRGGESIGEYQEKNLIIS